MNRAALRWDFLRQAGWGDAEASPLAGDASFRTYFRVVSGEQRAVLMDAPPPDEDVRPFVAIAKHLRELGFSAPEIIAADVDRGFLLLEDLGDATFNRVFASDPGIERQLYEGAVDLLISLHRKAAPEWLPPYDLKTLLGEARLFTDWYLPEVNPDHDTKAGQTLEELLTPLLEQVAPRAPVLTLRDYHVDNLMWLADRDGLARIGPLDFQDALAGHPAYDLASLLRDARREVSADLEEAMIARYLAACRDCPEDEFELAYNLFGVQRNAKIIGIFTRLWKRDGKPGYLSMIPHVWGLLERSLMHPDFSHLKHWFDLNAPAERRRTVLRP